MIERRVKDFRLDTRLKAACDNTITQLCSFLGDLAVLDTYDSSVINCLQVGMHGRSRDEHLLTQVA